MQKIDIIIINVKYILIRISLFPEDVLGLSLKNFTKKQYYP